MNKYIFSNTAQNIRKSGWRAYAVVFMMTITFLILGFLLVIMFTSQSIADYFVKKPEVIGFFKDDITEEQILEVKRELETRADVSEVKYVSKEQAMKDFLEENKDNQEVVEAVTINVFPAHLNVKASDLNSISSIAEYFRSNDKITDVLASEDILGTLRKIVSAIQIFGVTLLVIFSISTVLIIFLTIGITVYSQKQEIIVMKLVGANDAFVRVPYLLQSIFLTMLAIAFASLILVPFVVLKYNEVLSLMVGELAVRQMGIEVIIQGVVIMVIFGLLLSVFSSYLATRRYIDY